MYVSDLHFPALSILGTRYPIAITRGTWTRF